jgi:hypothetical protein
MTQRALLVTGIIALAFAVAAALLVNYSPFDVAIDFIALALDAVAAGIAGRLILGGARVHRYYTLGVVLLSAIAAAILTSATTSYLISQVRLFGALSGNVSPTPSSTVITTGIIGLVVYVAAATVYGFAGTRQGMGIGSRIGLLLLLLAAVVPFANVLGLLGLTITALVRTTPGAATPTPAPPAASE